MIKQDTDIQELRRRAGLTEDTYSIDSELDNLAASLKGIADGLRRGQYNPAAAAQMLDQIVNNLSNDSPGY